MNVRAFSPSRDLEISEQMEETAPNPEQPHVQATQTPISH
jgi:hypothetical protein